MHDRLRSPRAWALIYAALVCLLAIIVAMHDWRPIEITITIPPLIWYGVRFAGLWCVLVWCHTAIGDRFDEIEDAFDRWLLGGITRSADAAVSSPAPRYSDLAASAAHDTAEHTSGPHEGAEAMTGDTERLEIGA